MKLWLNSLALGGLLACGNAFAASAYQVKNVNQFVQLMEQINSQHAAKLKKFLAGLDPATEALDGAQVQQYCQLMQQRIDEAYLSYDVNRQLFSGQGATLSKQDFIYKAQADLSVQALKDRGLFCDYH